MPKRLCQDQWKKCPTHNFIYYYSLNIEILQRFEFRIIKVFEKPVPIKSNHNFFGES